jgi:hypothetical protein
MILMVRQVAPWITGEGEENWQRKQEIFCDTKHWVPNRAASGRSSRR